MSDLLPVFDSRTTHLVGAVLGLFLATMAAVVWRFSSDRPGRAWLGAYLLLVGANHAIVSGQYLAFGAEEPPAWLEGAAAFVQLFDPPVLLLAIVAITARRVPRRLLAGAAGLAAASVAAFLAGLIVPGAGPAAEQGLGVGLACAYAAAFAWLLGAFVREARPLQRDRLADLFVAFGAVLLTRIPLAANEVLRGPDPQGGGAAAGMAGLLAALLFASAAVAWLAARPGARRAVARACGRLGLALGAVAAVWLLALEARLAQVSMSLWYSSRWLVFAVVVAASIHRIGLLDIGEEGARRLRAGMSAAAFLTMASLLWSFLSGSGAVPLLPGLFASFAVAGLVQALFMGLLASQAPRGGALGWRQASVYRAHVELGTGAAELAALRGRLQVPAAEARRIERLVALEREAGTSPQDLRPGQLFAGRYEVRTILGVGGFGRAFLAFDRAGGGQVVLKELLEGWKRDPKALARFRNEVRALLRVSHPSLVGFRDLERTAGGHVLVLDYVPGPTLRDRIREGPMPARQAGRLGAALLSGLATLHGRGIAHGDVKPENVVLRRGRDPVLLDFGGARIVAHDTLQGPVLGTPDYLSPEARAGRPATPAADVHAVATVLWECLAGALPPLGRVPPRLRPVLEQALDPDPARRPAAAAFQEALEQVAAG